MRSGSLHVQYVFPKWFLQLAIETTATWSSLSGTSGTWTLKIPRIVQKQGLYHNLFRCLRKGDPNDVMKFMTGEGIRPFDIIIDQNLEMTALEVSILIFIFR